MDRLERLGAETNHIGKFQVAPHDEELIGRGDGLALHDPVLTLCNCWNDEMGPELSGDVLRFNRDASDADRNWFVSAEMDGAVEAGV